MTARDRLGQLAPLADTDPDTRGGHRPASTRPHTTHHESCGCTEEREKDLRRIVQTLIAQIDELAAEQSKLLAEMRAALKEAGRRVKP